MSSLNEKFSALKQDALLGKVVRNSAHLFSSNSLSLALSFLMGIMSARAFGRGRFRPGWPGDGICIHGQQPSVIPHERVGRPLWG